MNKMTKYLIVLICLGAVVSSLAAFVGAGLTGCAIQTYQCGGSSPEMFGWTGLFLIVGLIGLLGSLPGLLVILVCGVTWRTPLGKHLLLSTLLPFVLGGTAVSLIIWNSFLGWSDFILPGATCLAIAGLVEVIIRERKQRKLLGK